MIYLGLGSNLGDRKQHLSDAIEVLNAEGFEVRRKSPVVESPAWLKSGADPKWNRLYLNLIIEGECGKPPKDLLAVCKRTEQKLGRDLDAPRWSPRPIDIDIIAWEGIELQTKELVIPHPACLERPFVLTPLVHLNAGLMIKGQSVYEHHLRLTPIPLWMGIVNVTPDSFSDGGVADNLENLQEKLNSWIDAGIHILDIGAESTRPSAKPLSPKEEWQRLKPALKMVQKLSKPLAFPPLLSVDTRHAKVAKKALRYGMNWLNDVTGLAEPKLQKIANREDIQTVAMHSLSVPVDPKDHLEADRGATEQLEDWLRQRQTQWQSAGLNLHNILLDPGIGFGKTSLQNQALLKDCKNLRALGHRLLIGHSRKSFMNEFSQAQYSDRDLETLGVSMALCGQGVDVIRVHEPLSHMRAYRAWSHITI